MRRFTRQSTPSFIALLCLAMGYQARASHIIDSAVKRSGNNTAINLLSDGLMDGVPAYTDRTHVLVDIPDNLMGADLVQVSNSDKQSDPYEIEISVVERSILTIGLDDRNNPQPLPWMSDKGFTGLPNDFFNTQKKIRIDEGNDGTIDQSFTLWATLAPAGNYHTGGNNHSGNNYLIIGSKKVVPEPSSLALVGLGLLTLIGAGRCRHRAQSRAASHMPWLALQASMGVGPGMRSGSRRGWLSRR